MPKAEHLNLAVSDKLAAVTGELSTVLHNVIVEYEEEKDRLRKLLELAWNPELRSHRIKLPQHLVSKEELILEEQSSLNQDRNSTADQEEEVSSKDLKLKQEPQDLQLYSANETSIKKENPTVDWSPEEPSQECGVLIPVLTSVVSAANRDLSLYPGDSQSQEDECGAFSQNNTVRSAVRPYVCQTCSKSFRLKSNLQCHERIHTTERLFVCQTCRKGFRLRSSLNAHKIIHTGEKPYVCQTCSKGFGTKAHLKAHEQTHR